MASNKGENMKMKMAESSEKQNGSVTANVSTIAKNSNENINQAAASMTKAGSVIEGVALKAASAVRGIGESNVKKKSGGGGKKISAK